MTVDIKCPHCKKETDYNLKSNEEYCEYCNKKITYLEMYLGKTRLELIEEIIRKNPMNTISKVLAYENIKKIIGEL